MKEFESDNELLKSDPLAEFLRRRGFEFMGEFASSEEVVDAYRVADVAEMLKGSILNLTENKGVKGFTVSLTKLDAKFPIFSRNFGLIENNQHVPVLSKARANNLKSKRDQISKPEGMAIRGDEGALLFSNGWILAVACSNPEMDMAIALGLGIGARFTTPDNAEQYATRPEVNCRSFMVNEDAFVLPFYH